MSGIELTRNPVDGAGSPRRPARPGPLAIASAGQSHGNAKLNDTVVRDIRARHDAGE